MKTKGRVLAGVLLLLGCFSIEATAQDVIMALVKKCETMESVEINTIRRRNPVTKKMDSSVISIIIRSNPALVKEFQNAFLEFSRTEDSKNTIDQEIVNRKGGKVVNVLCRVGNVTYSFNANPDKEGDADVNVIERSGKIDDVMFNMETLRHNFDMHRALLEDNAARLNFMFN